MTCARAAPRSGANDLELTSAELRILELLVRADTRTVSRDELQMQALGRRLLPTDRSLDTHVSNLRRKILKHSDRVSVQGVRGAGYALTLNPAPSRAPRPRSEAMHSLYWRIFLAFWAALALILVGTVTVAVNATSHRTERPWVQRGQLYAQAARAFEAGGPDALKDWLQGLAGEPAGRTYIVGPDGQEMLGRTLPPILRATERRCGRRCRPGGDRPGRGRAGAGRTCRDARITWWWARCAMARACSASWSCPGCRCRSC